MEKNYQKIMLLFDITCKFFIRIFFSINFQSWKKYAVDSESIKKWGNQVEDAKYAGEWRKIRSCRIMGKCAENAENIQSLGEVLGEDQSFATLRPFGFFGFLFRFTFKKDEWERERDLVWNLSYVAGWYTRVLLCMEQLFWHRKESQKIIVFTLTRRSGWKLSSQKIPHCAVHPEAS